METGWIQHTNKEGGRIRVDGSALTVFFRWRDTTMRPNEVGHGSPVTFHIANNGRLAVGVRLLRRRR